jgi:hypothetical protein
MKHLKKSYTLLMLLTVSIGSRTIAQEFSSLTLFNPVQVTLRAKEVMPDNEYTTTGIEQGTFYINPLLLNGKPLDYIAFNAKSTGELTVIKGAALTGKTTQVLFYVYLRRDGNRVFIPGDEGSEIGKTKIDISQILRHAKLGDQLVIEPIDKADGPVKRILNIIKGGC